MGVPEPARWNPLRVIYWMAASVAVCAWLGPQFLDHFRPPTNRFFDFSQEWLSAKNYWSGTPVYADQTAALQRHTGQSPEVAEEMLPWNAHPPAAVALTLPLGKFSYRNAQLDWNLLTFPLFLLSVWLILRELKVPLAIWSIFPAVTLLLLCRPITIHLAQGQLNFPILFLLTLAWVADRRGKPGWAGVAAGIATGLKLYPGFIFVYFLFGRRWQALFTGVLAFAAVNGIALAVLGAGEFRTYMREVVPSLQNYRSSWRNVSLSGFCLRIFNPQDHEKIVPLVLNPVVGKWLALASQVIVTLVIAVTAALSRTMESRDRAFAAALVGMVLVSPIAWTHYFVLLVLPVALVWARLPEGIERVLIWPVILVLWAPENFFALLALGGEQAALMVNLRHSSIPAEVNLLALSIFTYTLVALLILVLRTPTEDDVPQWASQPRGAPADEHLNRRLFGSPSGEVAVAVEAQAPGK